MSPRVHLLVVDDCPSSALTRERLEIALREVDASDLVTVTTVDSAEQAELLGLRGSPTVLLDGHDPFSEPSTPSSLSCRLYSTPNGLAGSPTVEQLVTALRARSPLA